jgi:serine protease AprX
MKTSPTLLVSQSRYRRGLAAVLLTLLLISQAQAVIAISTSTQGASTDGIRATGIDGIRATGIDSLSIAQASGIRATGIDGIRATGIDGTTYQLDSIFIQSGNGIRATGIDELTAIGLDGVAPLGLDALGIAMADGLTATGLDSLVIFTANGIRATGIDGTIITIPAGRLEIEGVDTLTATGIVALLATGIDAITGLVNEVTALIGLQSIDTQLASLLNQLTDDSSVGAAIVFHHLPTEEDLNDLRRIGILGGSRYRVLPVILATTTKRKLLEASRLPAVRSIYGNRTLELLADPGRGQTGVDRAVADADLIARNSGSALTGKGVTVAVIDTGINGMHADLSDRLVQNVKLMGTMGLGFGFNYPIASANMISTDWLSGHGTFVAGVIAGSGAKSNGKFKGVAPGAKLMGLGAGDFNLFYVLEALDYLLWKGPEYGVKVVNCSFSAETEYDPNDPVNIGTKMLTERGVNVVFSAGNTGPTPGSLNPYAMAPWVISVGATDDNARIASFSSRGDYQAPFARPTLVTPGVNIISLRSNYGFNMMSILGLQTTADQLLLTSAERTFYATSSGTSFAAPQVAGAIALMLEANPNLTPAQIRAILIRSSTPLPPYYSIEVGAGMLNIHAATLEAAFPDRRMGSFKGIVGPVRFISDPIQLFGGVAQPLGTITSNLNVPANSLYASFSIEWQNTLLNDLGLTIVNPSGVQYVANQLNLPLLTSKTESLMVNNPTFGSWQAKVKNTLGLLATPQAYKGQLKTARVQYPELTDVSALSGPAKEEVYQNLRSSVMTTFGRRFRPEFTVSRYELASALVLGGRVPQYMSSQPRYSDSTDPATRLMVESAQSSPDGALFFDAQGAEFRPTEQATRLTTAVALVKAAGLGPQADLLAGAALNLVDQAQIPSQFRGYVSLAISKGLLAPDPGSTFNPNKPLTRGELSHAMATLARMAIN